MIVQQSSEFSRDFQISSVARRRVAEVDGLIMPAHLAALFSERAIEAAQLIITRAAVMQQG